VVEYVPAWPLAFASIRDHRGEAHQGDLRIAGREAFTAAAALP
jgi:hypothetical protein